MGIVGFLVRSIVFTVALVAVASVAFAAIGAGGDALGIDGWDSDRSLDEDVVEDQVQSQVNEIRADSSLIVLEHDRQLDQQSELHTSRMAENDVLSHQIARSTAQDRLGTAGCAYGSENIVQSWQFEDIEIPDGETITTHNEEELAKALVATWMSSEGHRQNILNSDWRDTAVSVEIRDDDKVYATQMFCE